MPMLSRDSMNQKALAAQTYGKRGKGALIFMRSDDLTSAEPEHGLPEKHSFRQSYGNTA